jgi:hypothetical protein
LFERFDARTNNFSLLLTSFEEYQLPVRFPFYHEAHRHSDRVKRVKQTSNKYQ